MESKVYDTRWRKILKSIFNTAGLENDMLLLNPDAMPTPELKAEVINYNISMLKFFGKVRLRIPKCSYFPLWPQKFSSGN